MKKTTPFTVLLLSATAMLLLVTGSCKKEDTSNNVVISKETVAGTYTIGSVMKKTGSGAEEDITDINFLPCEKDDLFLLKTDLTYDVIDAGTVCNPSFPLSGTWDVPNSTTFIMDGDAMTLKSFDGKTLQIATIPDPGDNRVYTYTFKKR